MKYVFVVVAIACALGVSIASAGMFDPKLNEDGTNGITLRAKQPTQQEANPPTDGRCRHPWQRHWQCDRTEAWSTNTPAPTNPPATATRTATPVPPRDTATPVPATATRTPTGVPPTATQTPTPRPTDTPTSGLWRPAPRTTWQWQLTGGLDVTVNAQMFDIDLFDNSAAAVAALHGKGSKVVCYMSAGSWENWRPDAADFPAGIQGKSNGWPGEKWLDIRQLSILGPIMEERLDLCRSKGFDGVEFDNVDGYSNNTGFPLTYQHQIAYNTFLANAAKARGLSPGLKNDVEQVSDLEPHFEYAINEECFDWNECDALLPFIEAGKAVFHVEYGLSTSAFCPQAIAMGFSSMRKNLDLDAWRQVC